MIQKWKMALCTFPYGGTIRKEALPWAMTAGVWASKQKDIDGGLLYYAVDDTPITMGRNLAVLKAIEYGVDLLLFLDSDMEPDIDKTHPFLPSAFNFIKSRWHVAPTIISAPYCMAGPAFSPVMGTFRTHRDGHEIKAEVYTREEAAAFKGIQPCALQATGLMLLDMRIFTGFEKDGQTIKLPPPYFYYQYSDETNSVKAATEDMVMTSNATRLFAEHGLEIGFVDWDAWAYHIKSQHIGRPVQKTVFHVAALHEE